VPRTIGPDALIRAGKAKKAKPLKAAASFAHKRQGNAGRFDGRMVFVPEGRRDSSQSRSAWTVGWTFRKGKRGGVRELGLLSAEGGSCGQRAQKA
jgi:hypothetical protein